MEKASDEIQERALALIEIAESQYGPKCVDWAFEGVFFQESPPHIRYFPERRAIMIALSNKAKSDSLQLDFQLSHEVAHSLYPSWDGLSVVPDEATVLNEGLSVVLSIMIVREWYGEKVAMELLTNLEEYNSSYHEAYALAIELLAEDHEAIKKTRAINPLVNELRESDFIAAGVAVPADSLAILLMPFSSIQAIR